MRKHISDTEYIAHDISIQHTTDEDGALITVYPCENTRRSTDLAKK